nr:phosphatase PAP2 family protein [Cohnella sp. WQ 127256]
MGVTVLAVVILLFLTFVLGHRKELILFITAIGGAALLNAVLKSIFQRDRPNIYRLAEETGYSFPSGHSMVAFALYVVLIYLLWRHTGSKWGRVILIAAGSLFIVSIGLSRIYLGVHYPSDVLGGYLASGIWLGLIIGIYQRLVRTLSNK